MEDLIVESLARRDRISSTISTYRNHPEDRRAIRADAKKLLSEYYQKHTYLPWTQEEVGTITEGFDMIDSEE